MINLLDVQLLSQLNGLQNRIPPGPDEILKREPSSEFGIGAELRSTLTAATNMANFALMPLGLASSLQQILTPTPVPQEKVISLPIDPNTLILAGFLAVVGGLLSLLGRDSYNADEQARHEHNDEWPRKAD